MAWADTQVLVDAVPSDATYLGSSVVGLPFRHAASQEVKSMEAGLSEAVRSVLQAAEKQGFSFVCLLSVPGENPIEISIPTVSTKLKLRRQNTAIRVAFYKDGHATKPIAFAAGKVGPGKPHVSMQIDKVSIPEGWTSVDWIYLNLPRIQSEAVKSNSPVALLQVTGERPLLEVAIPGMKEPLMVPEGSASLIASWYIDAAAEKRWREKSPTP